MCSSHYDSDCIEERNTTKILTCTDFIYGINPITLRCVRIVSISGKIQWGDGDFLKKKVGIFF